MSEHPDREPRLCLIGRLAQKFGCLPKKLTNTRVYYPITIRPVDNASDYSYSDDVKYNPGLLPPPDEPKPQTTQYVATYQYKPPQLPASPKKTPVAQTVPLSAIQLPEFNTFPVYAPTTTCFVQNPELSPVHPTCQISHTPCFATLSAIPQTPCQNAVPDSILQDLGNITPTQYTWNTPYGVLTYAPAPTPTHVPNPLIDLGSRSPHIADTGARDDGLAGLGLISSPISSDTSDSSSNCSSYSHRSGVALNPFLASNAFLPRETPIEWNVSEPVEMVNHALGDASLITNAREPATNPPTSTLHIELYFIDQPGVKWNWEPITVRKRRSIRIVDIFHSIHDYFQTQLTHAEYDVIKSYGGQNANILKDSWLERIKSHPDIETQTAVYYAGLMRVDCLGSSKKFAGLWVDGSQLKLGLRA